MKEVYDIAIVGAGPAGGNAALAAAGTGLQVALLDEQPSAGGQVWRAKSSSIISAPHTAESLAGAALRREIADSNITHLDNAGVWQISRDGQDWHLQVLRNGISEAVQAKVLILATGAREFVQPIPGWTTPGVIGLAGATALFKQNLSVPGKNTVVSGTGPLVFYVASEIRRLGGTVAAIVTPNTRRDWLGALSAMLSKPKLLARGAFWMADLMLARVPIYWGHAVTEVQGVSQISEVRIAELDAQWAVKEQVAMLQTDSMCLGNGLIPQIEAAQMLGVGIRYDSSLGGWLPQSRDDGATDILGLYLCGDGTGIRGADAAVLQGRLAGLRAASDFGSDTTQERRKTTSDWRRSARFGVAMTGLSAPRAGLASWTDNNTIVCRCESITKRGVLGEVDKGAASANAVKSGLRAGMGPCGGKYCQTAVAAVIAQHTGKTAADIAPPTARPPLRPVPLSSAAGSFDYDDLPIPKPAPL
jgi:thioredoxin reductase/bacterioferritin-associated ferredoxin